ncbi:MAG: type II toxin-antitoxin system VapC family toxin [gamma proteobacterium symbiont of Taylorina sp.]|nr:type II toxin-antitoxin system VapC family toxin [gamma proteobacterium symbiont of Taylorina sp.]
MIFDTNIFIYADRGVESARQLLLETTKRSISAVTYMEYVPFCRNKAELKKFEQLLTALHFKIYEIDSHISNNARRYVRQFSLSHCVEMGDALMAATAIKHDENLCTANIKHFEPISGLKVYKYTP